MKDHYVVSANSEGKRLDQVVRTVIRDQSRQQIQKWIHEGHIKVNDQQKKPNYRCTANDIIYWDIPENKPVEITPENIPLTILYEDDDVLVVNKPKGMLVHPTHTVNTGTLVNALLFHCATLSDLSGEERPGIVHRLDQDTSGLLIIAKNNHSHVHLKEQFQQRTVIRMYEAIVFGVIQPNQGIIQAPIGRNPHNRLQMAVVDSGKEAETHFNVLERLKHHTYVQCELKTGRTHQIRVHMKYMNHPIVGDLLYVRKKAALMKGQALFAKRLTFIHPTSEEEMTFEIDAPDDFQRLLNQLRGII